MAQSLVAERSLAVLAFKGHQIETKFSPKEGKTSGTKQAHA